MTPKDLERVIETCKRRDCLAPDVPACGVNELEQAVLELVSRVEANRRAFYQRGYGGPE